MKKYFVSSDIHGFYTEYMTALQNAGFDANNPEHMLIICGDMFDRGLEARELLSFFIKMDNSERLIFIRGNHEDLLDGLLFDDNCQPRSSDYSNGTVSTIEQLTEDRFSVQYYHAHDIIATLKDIGLLKLFSHALNYYEGKNYIFVHGWIPVACDGGEIYYDPKWREADHSRWNEARWENGMAMANLGLLEPNKTIVCGHWHASYGNIRKQRPNKSEIDYRHLEFSDNELFKPYYNNGIIAIDACTSFTHLCNVIVFTEDEI